MVTPFVQSILDTPLDAKTKGVPLVAGSIKLGEIGNKRWNVLRGDMMLPLLVMRDGHLRNNLTLMREFAEHHKVSLAPHGKSSFCPQLYIDQMEVGGSWGITAATIHQASIVAATGIKNIFIANELIGKANIEQLVELRRTYPDAKIYSLVDSAGAMEQFTRYGAKHLKPGERFQVLVEVGVDQGRAGVRTFDQAKDLIGLLMKDSKTFDLAGIECYEGLVARPTYDETMRVVDELLDRTVQVLHHANAIGAFKGRDEVILTAGGSAYYDRVVERFKRARNVPGLRIILRGGSYATYDHGFYCGHLRSMDKRQGFETGKGKVSALESFTPALEMMAAVVSLQDEGVAVMNMGIRDLPYDLGYPTPLRQYRDGKLLRGLAGPESKYEVTKSNDQHCYMAYPKGADIKVGDLFAFGISHPCTAFDKWDVLYRVDEDFTVTGALKTFF
ncbi:MAG: alanine racemase [Alphaproteobacteria bacterium]|nr:alanine racemase [Alphaproteobacteria bacterium]